ncbi:hypothetical protein BSKO_11047 [Bryopsis sp. KO-2023]|nr:hypothetical protein BSKO_11047 [Bryopsis sp. KO-2023]
MNSGLSLRASAPGVGARTVLRASRLRTGSCLTKKNQPRANLVRSVGQLGGIEGWKIGNIVSRRSEAVVCSAAADGAKDLPSELAGSETSTITTDADGVMKEPYPKSFVTARLVTFAFMWLAYGSYYLTRNSLAFTAPLMIKDQALGITMAKVGGLLSMQTVAYAFSKFISGVLGANFSATVLLAGGLVSTALCNVAFGMSSSYGFFLVFWGLNGLLQGIGAPACSRLLTNWFKSKERGTWWGLWTASNNVGGFSAPLLVGTACAMKGWRWGLFAPGAVATIMGIIGIFAMRDSPEAAGYPPVEATKKPKKVVEDDAKKASFMDSLGEVVKNVYVWLFAVNYFFVYVVRQGMTAWFVFYLLQAGGAGDAAQAAIRVSGLELGGLLGSLSSGAISDYLIRKNGGNASGNVGLRVKVVMAYIMGTGLMLSAFWASPNVAWLQWLLVAGCGFMLYGPQMLIGLCGAETVSRQAVSACQGFLGWISYLGAASAGVPLALIVEKYGWNVYFSAMIASCAVAFVLVLPMINLYSDAQKNEMAAAKSG